MNASWVFLMVSLAIVLGFYCLVLVHRRGISRVTDANCDWAEDFSIAKYRPMQRLLSGDDLTFLRSQPGYDRSLEKSLGKDRRRVFRSYLKSLRRDFDRLYFAAKQSILYSETDNSMLVQVLVRQRATFYFALGVVQIRLAMHALGLGTVEIQPLLGAVDAMRDAARLLESANTATA